MRRRPRGIVGTRRIVRWTSGWLALSMMVGIWHAVPPAKRLPKDNPKTHYGKASKLNACSNSTKPASEVSLLVSVCGTSCGLGPLKPADCKLSGRKRPRVALRGLARAA
jgi:hypothetical protein